MREIKFRAWHKERQKILGVFDINFRTPATVQVLDENYVLYDELFDCIELMQFTGMHDKNGVPIYEGDIVSGYVHFPEVNYIVCYNSSDYSCGFKCKQSDGAGVIDVWYKGLTVIGNIHQHAHLLEQNKC